MCKKGHPGGHGAARRTAPVSDLATSDSTAAARLDALVGAVEDAIVVIDEKAAIQTFNPAAERLFGYREQEILGQNVAVLMPQPYRSEHDDYVRRYLDTGEAKIIGKGRRVEAQRKDGSVFPAYLSVGDAVIDEQHVFVGILHDLTQEAEAERGAVEARTARLRAEQEAERLLQSLAHAGRLGLMGEMATSIAHEITQPLSAILNYTEACRLTLHQDALDPQQLEQTLDKIRQSAKLAGDVLRQLRTFVKKRETERRPTDIRALIKDVAALAEIEARRQNVRIDLTLDDQGMPPVSADRVQIQQVILNLLRNGMEAMKDTENQDRRVRVSVSESGHELHVHIADQGTSIAEGMEDQLFRPFFTTKESGMGMGLSICRSIIVGHGGRIWFTRNSDRGTTFHFTLPLAEQE